MLPVLITGLAPSSPQSTTIRLLTMAALRSSSISTTWSAASFLRAVSTIETAPSTIFSRAEMMASACCRLSITLAISWA